MSIILTGDTHGRFDRLSNLKEKAEYVIVLGDFGLLWNYKGQDDKEKNNIRFLDSLPFITLAVLGNHECFPRIYKLKEVDMFGGKVYKVSDKVYYFKNGEIYNIDGKSFFVIGGARSVDKLNRVIYESWWPEEEPTYSSIFSGLIELVKSEYKVDYVLTHTLPSEAINELSYMHGLSMFNYPVYNAVDPTQRMLTEVEGIVKRKHWYAGHFHENQRNILEKYTLLYEDYDYIP